MSSAPDFKKLFESAPGLFVVLNPELKVVAVNDGYLEVARASRDHVTGKIFFDVFPDPGGLKESFQKVLRTREADRMEAREYRLPRPAEEGGYMLKYWSSVNAPLFSPSGELTHIIRRVDDVTKQVFREGERKVIEHERDLFFTHSFDLMAVVGSDGYFKKLNPSFERTMGYRDEELLARPIVEFLHPDDVGKTKVGIATLADGTPTISSKNRYRCKDGSYKWFLWNTTPMGEVFHTVGRDITEEVQAEERRTHELNRSEAQVQQLQKMDAIGRLAGGIAHDFNNMLGAISLYCDVVAEAPEDAASVRNNIKNISEVTSRAAALTRQLLVFSRKQLVQKQAVNLNPLIHQLEKMLVRLIGENIRFHTKTVPDLRSVRVDPSQMEQVILNLVVNARDAMPGGGNITIETSNIYLDEEFTSKHLSVKPGHYVMLSVSDDGEGMDAETTSKIFEPFFTTKPVGKGTGLGLTTTYGVVKQSNGTIWVYSEPGKGSVFKIYLPVADQPAEEVVVPQAEAAKPASVVSILLVEDDEMLRTGFTSILKRKGFKVLVAAGPEEALQIAQNSPDEIQLLLTDVVMPGLTGFELAKKIRETRKDIRVLYMSGYTDDALESSGATDVNEYNFIQKPFGTNALLNKVNEVLE